MKELVAVLVVWLSASFDLPATGDHPSVRFESPAMLTNIRYGSAEAAAGTHVVALYDGRTETIVLTEGWDSSDPADVSVLVHELVHHLQEQDRRRYPCAAAREKLAYEAQARWLDLFGMDLEAEFQINPMALKLRTSCLVP